MREANPLVESYLIQLDLEGVGMAALQSNTLVISGCEELEKGVVSVFFVLLLFGFWFWEGKWLTGRKAGMSVQEPKNEAEWITFVSPLVRIVEETEAGMGSSPERDQGVSGVSLSDLKGKGRMGEERMVVEGLGSSPAAGSEMEDNGMWNDDLGVGIQEDPFNALMDFGRSR